jgi:streptogramin lyase
VSITNGPDGNVWFTEVAANRIGVITPSGTIAEYTIPTPVSGPFGITLGPDNNLWFTEFNTGQIGKVVP